MFRCEILRYAQDDRNITAGRLSAAPKISQHDPNTSVSATAGRGTTSARTPAARSAASGRRPVPPCEPLTSVASSGMLCVAGSKNKLHRIVARLAVDVDRAGEAAVRDRRRATNNTPANFAAWRSRSLRRCGDVPGRIGRAACRPTPRQCPAGRGTGRPRAAASCCIAVGHEDVGELMIDQRKGPAPLEIQVLAVGCLADRQQARLAEHAVRDS